MPVDRPRVLVCDDSPLLRRVIVVLLTESGLNVVGEARDGVELIDRVAELRPDVVTLDVEMPRRNGLEALRELMRVRPTPVVMVSTLTGSGSAASVAALAAGASSSASATSSTASRSRACRRSSGTPRRGRCPRAPTGSRASSTCAAASSPS